MKFRFHILGNPLVPTNTAYSADAFNILAMRFSEIMTNHGHTVYFYGTGKSSDIKCTQYHQVVSSSKYRQLKKLIGSFNAGPYLTWDVKDTKAIQLRDSIRVQYVEGVASLLLKNKKPGDFLLHFYTSARFSRDITRDLIEVEPCLMGRSAGIDGKINLPVPNVCFATKVYQEFILPIASSVPENIGVIPPVFNPEDFLYTPVKDKYFLYLARIQHLKGVGFIFELAKRYPEESFHICGYLSPSQVESEGSVLRIEDKSYDLKEYPNVKFLGYAEVQERKKLLSRAKALVQPSMYFEPFGFNVIEAYLSGTPVITSKNGSFLETVQEGKTGFRCESWTEYDHAFKTIGSIKPEDCRAAGMKYTEKYIYPRYMDYYTRLYRKYMQ